MSRCVLLVALTTSLAAAAHAGAQPLPAPSGDVAAYRALRAFTLDGSYQAVSGLRLTRDRAEMTFTGTFYFSAPVMGRVTGAVFVGRGMFRAAPPDRAFERDNLRRILKADAIDSDFETAILQFTDDTNQAMGGQALPGTVVTSTQALATSFNPRLTRETGANVASRLLLSLREREDPGVFVAEFDGGRLGPFAFVLDHQSRLPATHFGIDAGEKGIIFSYDPRLFATSVWLAFGSLDEERVGTTTSADAFQLARTSAYSLTVDLREPRRTLDVDGRIDLVARVPITTISFALGESLPEFDKTRLKKQMRIKAVRVDGQTAEVVQEDWEGGFTVLFPSPLARDEGFSLEFEASGDYIRDQTGCDCFVPLNNTEWYPRHGSSNRSTFELKFLHRPNLQVASSGVRIMTAAPSESADTVETVYRVDTPVGFVGFALANYRVRSGVARTAAGGAIPLELFSMPNRRVDEDFILGEMERTLTYFSGLFGAYPYPVFRAAFHLLPFGQGLASLLMVPNVSPSSRATDLLVAHETAHEWWGNVVAWRSYRDQWLSEGFAQSSSLLYAATREKPAAMRDRLDVLRSTLREGPRIVRGGGGSGTRVGIGRGKVTDIGPLVLGQRLNTIESANGYQRLIYNKGALVLRMLHFLLTNPSATSGGDAPFFSMMTDFVRDHQDRAATTAAFQDVASRHFASSVVARRFGMTDLDWFFRQWVLETPLPTYRFEYILTGGTDGQSTMTGLLFQDNAPAAWKMPVPVVATFADGHTVGEAILADGPRQRVTLTFPSRPVSIELDPERWVLSEKTSTRQVDRLPDQPE